ncbi:MAG: hypothetical protein R6X02_13030 [Enhygromyxa sp.]
MIPPRARLWVLLLLWIVIAGCGVRKGAPEWIGSDAAVVRCTIAGPNLALPRLFDELPSPALPTGLYARTMDPIALDQLGFERDRVVCASLQAPDADALERAREGVARLHAQRRELIKSTRKLGACRCAYAELLGARALVPDCVDKPSKRGCEIEPETLEQLQELLAPFEATLARTEVPRAHWRLFGRTDRPGRFVAQQAQLLGRHRGGSEVFVRKNPLPPQPGMKLISELLALEHVVAVVRQDSGRGLLVVREIDRTLVLDHFAYPDWHGAGVTRINADLFALLGHLDDAQVARYRAALEPPSQRRELLMNPRKGYMVELDHAALERVDQALLIAAEYAQLPYDEAAERRELPPAMVDRLAFQVPFGTEGEVLRARMRLTDQGREWLASVAGQRPVEAAAILSSADQPPVFEPADPAIAQLFVLRGQPVEQSLFAGLPGAPKLWVAIAGADPRALDGKIDDFELALPTGPLPGNFASRPGLVALRERLSISPHTLAVELVEGGRVLAVELTPR